MKKKRIKIIIISAVVLLVLAGAAVLFYVSGLVSYKEDLKSGVNAEVVIERDSRGVPRVIVSTPEDLYFALGFIHAQDRFVYMEYFRAIVRSRLSDITGEEGRVLDRFARVIGFLRKAREIESKLDKESLKLIQAYVKGVNLIWSRALYKNSLDKEWSASDVIAVFLMKEWTNSFLNNQELIFPLAAELKKKNYAFMKEIFPADLLHFYQEDEKKNINLMVGLKKLLRWRIGSFNRGYALYVPASMTGKRKSFSCFSYDDMLSVYPGWYPLVISLNGTTIEAVTHAGLPFIFAGNNGRMSFFGFSLNVDVQDFFLEKIRTAQNVPQYLGRGGWENFNEYYVSAETAGPGIEKKPVRETDNGPVINDIFGADNYSDTIVTVKSLFPQEDYISLLFSLPFAVDIQRASRLTAGINSPPHVYFFTSEAGTLKVYSGKIPRRNENESVFNDNFNTQWYGTGDLGEYRGWNGSDLMAGSSFLMDAPAQIKPFTLPDNSRYSSLQNLLTRRRDLTAGDITALMHNKQSIYAREFMPFFLSMLEPNPITSARLTRIYFHDWNFSMDTQGISPSIFTVLLQKFIYETFKDEAGGDINRIIENYPYLLPGFLGMVKTETSPFFDDTGTYAVESRDTIFDRAFLGAMRYLNRSQGPIMAQWEWGSLHRGHFTIPFAEKSFISRLIYKIEDKPIAGGTSTIYYGGTGPDFKPFETTSLCGYFNDDSSDLFMYFAYSINPMSEFYYGKMNSLKIRGFNRIVGEYVTRIKP